MTELGIVPYGDRAWLISTGGTIGAHRLFAALSLAGPGPGAGAGEHRAPAGLIEATVGFESVVVELSDPAMADGAPDDDPGAWEAWLVAASRNALDGAPSMARNSEPARSSEPALGTRRDAATAPRTISIPAEFDGPDLDEVSELLGTTPAGVIDRLLAAELTVAFIGFSPGFPYLVGLPDDLASVERRATPRSSVPAGSIAVAGGFATVYPHPTPGGWQLLGRTDLSLFDPDRPPYALLRAGDTVRFLPRSVTGLTRPSAPTVEGPSWRGPLTTDASRAVEILDPGLFSLVQDAGRRSMGGLGIPRAGPADPVTMELANRLMGNPPGAAAIEITARGPRFRVDDDLHLTVVGIRDDAVPITVDGRPVADGVVIPVAAGQVVEIGVVRHGIRSYLALSGGIESPVVVGSRSSDVLANLGIGALMVGDRLGLGAPTTPHGHLAFTGSLDAGDDGWTFRVVGGPHQTGRTWLAHLESAAWEVGESSNRVGVRLRPRNGSLRSPPAPSSVPSTGMITGSIQLPPDGNPIILMPDHATVGGYPVIATVISADRGNLGQLSPGDIVRFTEVDLHTARTAAKERIRELNNRISGWYPTTTGR